MSRASIMNIGEHEYPFLEEVFTPAEQPKIDFVFVHGLNPRGRNDHPFETWTHQNGTFWPRDLLPHDIPQARIFIYGYNSNITNPQTMSTAGVRDHANTLLNLLDMGEVRSWYLSSLFSSNVRLPKIIFIGHSLGGLVIKQALLNAQEDPKYTAIRTGTSGLVFFGCPHHGTKGVELGKIAAKVARFMSVRFSHQLEDYKVVSFIEGKEVLLGGSGPASISHLVVDEESAVLGLPGQRETRLKLDADHSQMCKVGSRGSMYKLIKGNIKQIADSRVFDRRHPLAMKAESLMGEILCHKGKYQEGESTISIRWKPAEDSPRRMAVSVVARKASLRLKRAARLQHLLGENHIQALAAVLCTAELVVSNHTQTEVERAAARFNPQTQTAVDEISKVSRELHNLLGPRHPLTIWGLRILGASQMQASASITEPSETLRRALASAEEYLGADHPGDYEHRGAHGHDCLGSNGI
ncbi:uncharacterized protein ATNIH1004_002016 [Aspergillus tanneri]|uniref:DUF676 domain-containing protein n=1 Tax=Aspergillus tanneri TaxID=1220188 RepID=A0A5M9M3M5_9EURO|nr:uncharacterized protein ATNIH1004_002016 [Aspergillus tanneri]KAA8641348.1 hypothetical protein ATNIH1004_002016 [Aspergillus tanneri]